MAMRLTGLMSGMDTESMIQELVEVRKKKVDTVKKEQTKLDWKQEAWKDLSKKLKNLQTKYLNNMRFAASYSKMTTNVSNSSAVSVITGGNAVNGVQTLEIEKLAKTGYLTGGKIQKQNGGNLTALSKVSDIAGFTDEGSINIKAGSKSVDINITKDTTISDVLTQMKKAGVNASFDEKNQRFFVSATKSGAASDFSITASDANGEAAMEALGLGTSATKIKGQDAVIYLNDAKFESSDNVFEINGLTITALNETKSGEKITLTTQQDTDGIYDMIKGFLKEYNSIMNEMDKMYNAESAKGYEPLTSEEKYEMADKEVEEWEKKIKDSILRRDETVSSVSSALREIMAGGAMINGKKMFLSDFGVATLGYFNAPDGEKHAYHIDGDADDENTAMNTDKLKSMISTNPDTVIAFFSQLSKDLYARMDKMSSAVKDQRTYGSFFDDKKMKSDYDDYTKKIADLEKKLTAYEDKWYAKFGAMEKAMAKMQSNANALTGLLGGQ